jgi:hypothetical protein
MMILKVQILMVFENCQFTLTKELVVVQIGKTMMVVQIWILLPLKNRQLNTQMGDASPSKDQEDAPPSNPVAHGNKKLSSIKQMR